MIENFKNAEENVFYPRERERERESVRGMCGCGYGCGDTR